MALSADAGGALRLWGLADGAQLAAVWGGTGSGPVTSACFLCDGTVATARGSLVSVWRLRLGAATGLELAAELCIASSFGSATGRARTVAALASGAKVLAAGCSDGSMLLWQQSSSGDWQQQPVLTSADGSAATALAFSSDASLLAGAAGAAVGIWSAASGQQLARLALPAAPAALMWTQAEQLLALTATGALQPLGSPRMEQQEAGPATAAMATAARASVVTAPAAAPQAGAAQAAKQKKCVRFAEAPQAATEALHPEPLPPHCMPARAGPPPPLPLHPLLRGRSTGSSRSSSPVLSPVRKPTATIRGSNQPGATPGTAAAAMPVCRPSRVKPLYPILDFRALRGLQAAAPLPAAPGPAPAGLAPAPAAPAVSPSCTVDQARQLQQPALAGDLAGLCNKEDGTFSLESKEQPPAEAAEALQPPALPSTAQPEVAADDEAVPRQVRLPAPVQRQCSSLQLASGTSRQRDACTVAAREAGGSRPASPAKQALLTQLAALRQEASEAAAELGITPVLCTASDISASASDSCAASRPPSCRPPSPLKLGVACTRAAQQEGQLQTQEVQAHTGATKKGGSQRGKVL